MRSKILPALLLIACLFSSLFSSAQKEFRNWPAGASPQEVGKRVAERFVTLPHRLTTNQAAEPYIDYPESVTWYGALTFAQLGGDKDLTARLVQRFDPLFGDEAKLIPVPKHVDLAVFGAVPLQIYIENKQKKYLGIGQAMADKQWSDPTPDGLSSQTRFWIDDMYMLTLVEYRKMMTALLKYQASDGMWRQLIDHPEAWPETSSTGMFTFAMVTGVKNGWLDKKTYAPAARKAWLALLTYMEPNGDIRNVCEGTGKNNDYQYYIDRKKNTGDLHGEAPILWTASAFLR